MLINASAKINIGLQVKKRREDGYHDIETVFYNIEDYHDIIEILPSQSDEDEYIFHGKEILGDIKENLIYKAVQLIKKNYPTSRIPLKIILLKNIPMGAGLGGGSSNAAHVLKGMNQYFDLHISDEELERLALELGSDCPFFIKKQSCVAQGRGEIFTPISIDLSAYSIQVITPFIHISTAMAFHNLQIKESPFSLFDITKFSVEDWKGMVSNDFESTIFPMFPEIEDIKQQLYDQGALYASMSGTGSSVFGIFNKEKKATIVSTVAFEEFYCK